MEKYHKEGGFFDRLERFSSLIDRRMNLYVELIKYHGVFLFVPGFKRLTAINSYIKSNARFVAFYQKKLDESRDLYNREKYWWMAEK